MDKEEKAAWAAVAGVGCLGILLKLAIVGVVLWAIVALVSHLT